MKSKKDGIFDYLKFVLFLGILILFYSSKSFAQCSNWGISVNTVTTATCAANGSFVVKMHGTDVANLSNIEFGIPTQPNGFSVPLNSDSNFRSIPQGTISVTAIASCGGTNVGRTIQVNVPGNYTLPKIIQTGSIPTLSCRTTGEIYGKVSGGTKAFTYTLKAWPSTYTGSKQYSDTLGQFRFSNLPSGNYTVQVVDGCNSGTALYTFSVSVINPVSANLYDNNCFALACDSLLIHPPLVFGGDWDVYLNDTGFQYSVKIKGGAIASTAFAQLKKGIGVHLTSPYTIKDLYSSKIEYTFRFPCGTTRKLITSFPKPRIYYENNQKCDSNFYLNAYFDYDAPICFPVTYHLRDVNSNRLFSSQVITGNYFTTPSYPLGSYYLVYTTSDGYKDSIRISTQALTGIPYTVHVGTALFGLHNYVDYFYFNSNYGNIGGNRTIELFSGPIGYSYKSSWIGSAINIYNNGFPTANTLKFPVGNYVWKITDECAVYYLSVTVSNSDLCQFTLPTPTMQQTCQGLNLRVNGSVTVAGASGQFTFSLFRNGSPYYVTIGGTTKWPSYPSGSSVLLPESGHYTIIPSVANGQNTISGYYTPTGFYLGYPNKYTKSFSFDYVYDSLSINNNQTQGFICSGANQGGAIIAVKGQGGFPYKAPVSHYKYTLALPGKVSSGPFLASNDSGFFAGFGGNARDSFDVKVEDSCGAFAVQRVYIIDLDHVRAISSSAYLACLNEDVQLSAIYLPNATYAWTGPGGFTSSLRNPIISKISNNNAGKYYVSISTTACGSPVRDSVRIAIAPQPPKPQLSYNCLPRPITVNITNPNSSFAYMWDVGILNYGILGKTFIHDTLEPANSIFQKSVLVAGSYAAIAIDTLSQCKTKSDSIEFLSDPTKILVAGINNTHKKLCTGDTTTLTAVGFYDASSTTFQWYRNGVPIPGADSVTLPVSASGRYRVAIDAGLCQIDTSQEDTIIVTPRPVATIIAFKNQICQGDSVRLTANSGTGLSYSWQYNGGPIALATKQVYYALVAGNYSVVVSNGGCIATSSKFTLVVTPAPTVRLKPSGKVSLCPGQTITIKSKADSTWTYTWFRDHTLIAGASTDTITTALSGVYFVKVNTPICPAVISDSVEIVLYERSIFLGNDTLVCNKSFQIPLAIDTGFTGILWSTGATGSRIVVTKPGTYWVSASNKCGTFHDTIKIIGVGELLPKWPEDTIVCNPAGYTYFGVSTKLEDVLWSTGSTSYRIRVDSPTTIWVRVSTPCGYIQDTLNIQFCKPNISKLALSNATICAGDCISPHAEFRNFPKFFLWSFPGGHPSSSTEVQPGLICYDSSGIYPISVVAQNRFGIDTATSAILVTTLPKARFEDTALTIPYKTNLDLPACGEAMNKDWYLGDSLICANCASLHLNAKNYQTVYRCILRNGDCRDSCTYAIQVLDIPNDLWMPNAFTPNNDGRNDFFHIITDNPNIRLVGLNVYNRWGQQVYASDQNSQGWDGTLNGQPAAAGTYFWQLQYRITDEKNKLYLKKGDVLLIR
ncbi:MAG: gliding motility-associated C-terminal domain-containing protein [Bacteroidetes bacterium]|nr:gliding motility-associated C-terminal domain-containing protein [Bacteroidota bacterium]